MPKSIVVVGGTGFLGSRICREAALRGIDVVSLSRLAPPAALLAHPWASKVAWRTADVLSIPSDASSPPTPEWKALFEGKDAVVHCVGQLLADASYKDALRQGDALRLAGIAASGAKDVAMGLAGTAMSLASGVAQSVSGRPATPSWTSGQGTFPSFSGASSWASASSGTFSAGSGSRSIYSANRDSALATANAAADAKVGQYIFVSAADLFPFQTDYMKSKRQAERMLLDPSAYGFSAVVIRPGGLLELVGRLDCLF